MEPTSVISGLSASIKLVSQLRAINEKVKNAEFSNALADLSLELAKLKAELASVLDENTLLKAQLSSAQRGNEEGFTFERGAYFNANGEGPFCPGCYDSSKKPIRLSALPKGFGDLATHTCPVCKAAYTVAKA